ncbi:hypothetical protein FHW69_001297 [Luteibacter sp. Sphag1AF]|uniref:DUF2239 family protein n=1 Tax=Luteibacter sp. Sphag1AF TaxID=2587031 RepID=UPI00161EBFC5|nr:DUF2239 family protein [Luteibacter sp. Sphag1AF]MBB3226707.1 hypothetical protein [Luteibacter sp. Sphag1AF]
MPHSYIAFEGTRRLAAGPLAEVASHCKRLLDERPDATVSLFDDATGRALDIDFRGSVEDVLGRLQPAEPAAARRGPGRPRLGVVAREVTLLPRHWDWLAGQPGGASVALRRLVEHASRGSAPVDAQRAARDAVYNFMYATGGNLPDYEEASRAFNRQDRDTFERLIAPWPADVRDHILYLADIARGRTP